MVSVNKRAAEVADDSKKGSSKRIRSEVQQTLYVKNLNDKVNRAMLKHTLYLVFSTYGEVLDINMKMKGQAHVIFYSDEAASHALRALQGTNIFEKDMRIDYANRKSVSIEAIEKAIAEED